MQRTVQMQTYPLRKSNITVDFLPEPAIPAIVADPNQLMQVFLNLLLNAEQAIRESREKGTIRIRIGRKPDSVWLIFQDDGPGIATENLAHIFDPFFTTKRPGRGTGLGLSICKTVRQIPDGSGIVVEEVADDSPAQKAGLRQHEILISFDDQRLYSPEQLVRLVDNDKPGREAKLHIIRNGKSQDIEATLGSQQAESGTR